VSDIEMGYKQVGDGPDERGVVVDLVSAMPT